MDLPALYQRAVEHTATLIANVDGAQLADPTACSDWDVRELRGPTLGVYGAEVVVAPHASDATKALGLVGSSL